MLKSSPKPNPATHWIRVGEELVVARFDTRQFHVLNSTAALVWQFFDGSVSVRELSMDVAEAFDLDRSQVEAELVAFVESAVQNGLLSG